MTRDRPAGRPRGNWGKRDKYDTPIDKKKKLTPELQASLVKWIEAGNYIETAASLAGLNKQTIYNWIKKGHKQNTGEYRRFVDAIKKAEANSEARLLLFIEKAAVKQWQAAAWRLERKWPQKWGRKDTFHAQLSAYNQNDKRAQGQLSEPDAKQLLGRAIEVRPVVATPNDGGRKVEILGKPKRGRGRKATE